MMKGLCVSVLAVFSVVGAALGDEQEGEKPRSPFASLVPLRVQVVLTRTLGEKKISSMPYTLSVMASDPERPAPHRSAAVRTGIQIPLTVRAEGNAAPTVTFTDVGTNLDCDAYVLEGGRYKVDFTIEQGSLASGDWGVVSSTPVLRSFKSRSSLILRDGQTGRYVAATDPVTGEVLQIDVTLNVVK